MVLLRLPSETLTEIFEYLGSSFFHEDLRRLTVCKEWFQFALPTALKSIKLSQVTLRDLILFWENKRPFPLLNILESIDLELDGYQACIPTRHEHEDPLDTHMTPFSGETRNGLSFESWSQLLNHSLDQLVMISQQSRKLRKLCIRAIHAPPSASWDVPREYLSFPRITAIFSTESLRVLILDLTVDQLIRTEDQDSYHICPAIGARLHNLETLHLRMPRICPDVLTLRDSNDHLRLKEVVINLSLLEGLSGRTSAVHSRRCNSANSDLIHLKSEMWEQTKALADRMSSPKTFKILTHTLPSFEIQTLDVLTGKVGILGEGMQWNEDGEAREEVDQDIELESEISSLSDW